MCAAAKNCEKFTKNPLLGVQGRSRLSRLIKLKSPWLVLVMISNMSVPICNRFHDTRDNCGKITTFYGGSRLAPASLNLVGRDLDCWNLRLVLKISCAGCLGLSPAISSQFSVEICAASKNCEKFAKNPFLGVQGRSRSSMLINLKSLSPCSACYDKQRVFTCLQPFSH